MADFFTRSFTPAATGFCGSRIDRADHMRRDPQAVAAARMHPGARWLPFDTLRPLLADGALLWIDRAQIPADALEVFLGLEDGAPRFAIALPARVTESLTSGNPAAEAQDARGAAMTLPADQAAIVAHGRSLIDWHQRHGFCANCGAPTNIAKAGYARACARDRGGCGAEHFPRTDPVVIMLAIDGDKCLLGRQPSFPARFMSALAGFVEPGESIEEAVRRELHEEAGIRTARVTYVASQPWPFPSSLMIGAFAEAVTTDIRLDEDELEEARWFTRAEVEAVLSGDGPFLTPPPMAIAWTLMKTWVDA
jgi:NAD+ diphosphatase|tara:strand:- start:126508 stop:127431 length:924 start_codon:yes stop_codon:yes gene_type:complete